MINLTIQRVTLWKEELLDDFKYASNHRSLLKYFKISFMKNEDQWSLPMNAHTFFSSSPAKEAGTHDNENLHVRGVEETIRPRMNFLLFGWEVGSSVFLKTYTSFWVNRLNFKLVDDIIKSLKMLYFQTPPKLENLIPQKKRIKHEFQSIVGLLFHCIHLK